MFISDIKKIVSTLLFNWTNKRWVITFTKKKGNPTKKQFEKNQGITNFNFNDIHLNDAKVVKDRETLLELLPKNGVVCELGVNKGRFSEKILKSEHEYSHDNSDTKENTSLKKPTKLKKAKSVAKTPNKVKKVSKK